ncbi:hypothetical protein EV426DRAFT_711291 [Tirmania nivea]|nr:hypothetical protein EV426DRAFT_711291 [Tirmania nivea]
MYLTPFSFSSRSPSLSSRLLALFLLAFVCCDVVFGGAVLRERQDGVSGLVVETTVIASTTGSGRSPSTTPAPKKSGAPTSEGSQANSTSTREPVPTLIQDEGRAELDPNTSPVYSGVGLPIMPEVTPGIAVAGVLLMLAGLPFCLIGIKKTKLQIFLSVAYLCSLGVTVLIVYVMNPPVRDAIQGAYVVAATITGLFFGAIAVIFPEVTEKLGCLLGGFCLSMWFLVLKPGGLINNTYGKLIMIAVSSLVVFALAFHGVTKPYALISACAFSGATSIVLGIDCFSRAGLKEFWLYIWDLNSSMFPLNTDTYPHTRGMRVEIAIILLITIFGIMSQMKLWKILKERRDLKRAQRLKEQEDVERLNEDVGRRVEEEDRRARAEWEKIYGNADGHDKDGRPDSGVAPSQTDSKITLTEENGVKEVGGFAKTEHMKQERDEHVQMARQRVEGETVEETVADAEEMAIDTGLPAPGEQRMSLQPATEGEALEVIAEQVEEEQEVLPSSEVIPSPPPPLVLIRQHVPYIPDEEDCQDDAMSLATYADTITHTAHLHGLIKNQEIDTKHAEVLPDSSEILPAQETIAETERIAENNSNSEGALDDKVLETSNPADENAIIVVTGLEGRIDKEGEAQESGNSLTQLQPTDGRTVSSITSDERKVASTVSEERKISSVTSGDRMSSLPASFADLETLQNHCSRIHRTYRTNEWAKHLADAEAVELDDLTPYVEEGVPEEAPVPVLVSQLQETAIPEPRPNLSKPRRASYEHSPRAQTPLSFAVCAQIPHAVPVPAPLPASTATPTTPPPTPSVAVAASPKHILKSSSIPIIPEGETPVSEKPAVQNLASPPPPTRAMSPAPVIPYENTLIGRRESMLKMRPSQLIQEQMIRAASPSGRGDTASVYNMNTNRLTPINMEDMTLSQRREYLLSQQMQSRTQTPIPQLSPRNSIGVSPPSPTAGTVAKQTQLLHTWRECLKQDAQISQQSKGLRSERQALEALNEKQQAAIFKKEKEAEKVQRTALVEGRMRTPVMLNAHREAMRKLQAAASTH